MTQQELLEIKQIVKEMLDPIYEEMMSLHRKVNSLMPTTKSQPDVGNNMDYSSPEYRDEFRFLNALGSELGHDLSKDVNDVGQRCVTSSRQVKPMYNWGTKQMENIPEYTVRELLDILAHNFGKGSLSRYKTTIEHLLDENEKVGVEGLTITIPKNGMTFNVVKDRSRPEYKPKNEIEELMEALSSINSSMF